MCIHWTSCSKHSEVLNLAATCGSLVMPFSKEEPGSVGAAIEPTIDVEGAEVSGEALPSEWSLTCDAGT